MTKRYSVFDETGKSIARYSEDVNQIIPEAAVEISEEIFLELIDDPLGIKKVVNGTIVLDSDKKIQMESGLVNQSVKDEIHALEKTSGLNRRARELFLQVLPAGSERDELQNTENLIQAKRGELV